MKKTTKNSKGNFKGVFMLLLTVVLIIALVFVVKKWMGDGEEKKPVVNQTQITNNANSNGNEIVEVLSEVTSKQADGTVVNTSDKIREERSMLGYNIKNAELKQKIGQTEFVAEVTNATETDKDGVLIDVVLYDKGGNEIGRIPGSIIEVKAGETIVLRAAITENYIGAYDYKLEAK